LISDLSKQLLRRFPPFLAAAILIGLCVVPARADVLFTYGYSPRGIGMGGAMSATADDFAAAYYNPAGTVFQSHPTVGVGYLVTGSAMTGVHIEAPDLEHTQGLVFGMTLPIPLGGFLRDRLAFGFASFFPNGLLLGIHVPYPTDPQYVILQNSGRSLTTIPTLAIKLTRGLSVGGGTQIFDNTAGQFNAVVDPNGAVQATVGEELTASYAATFGLMIRPGEYWSPLEGLRFGLVFRDRFYTRYRIPVNSYISSVPLAVYFSAISIYTPRQWVAAVAYSRGRWLWEADLSFNEWSNFPDPNLKVDVNLKIPLLPVTFRNSASFPPHFHDTLTLRAGTEVLAVDGDDLDFFVRAGYSFDPSPVPAQTGDTNYLDTDRHIGGLSLGLQWQGVGETRFETPFAFDVGLQAQYLVPRTSYKLENISPDNPGYPRVGFEGWLYAVVATIGTQFDFE
jgi:long-chain fatty acid transport protein